LKSIFFLILHYTLLHTSHYTSNDNRYKACVFASTFSKAGVTDKN